MVSGDGDFWKASCWSRWPRRIIARCRFGTSIPSVERPAMRSMRTDSALSASARSSCRLTIWLTFTPGAGWNSNTVITGPGLIPSTVPSTPNSVQRCADGLAEAHQLALVETARHRLGLQQIDRRQRQERRLSERQLFLLARRLACGRRGGRRLGPRRTDAGRGRCRRLAPAGRRRRKAIVEVEIQVRTRHPPPRLVERRRSRRRSR